MHIHTYFFPRILVGGLDGNHLVFGIFLGLADIFMEVLSPQTNRRKWVSDASLSAPEGRCLPHPPGNGPCHNGSWNGFMDSYRFPDLEFVGTSGFGPSLSSTLPWSWRLRCLTYDPGSTVGPPVGGKLMALIGFNLPRVKATASCRSSWIWV